MSDNLKNFNFSFSLAKNAKKELESEHLAISSRIDAIVDSEKFNINGFPVLKNIMILNPTKNDLKKIGKALDRLGDLIEVFNDLDKKINVINTLHENPTWFAWSCGDFTQEIEQDIESLFKTSD
jgi:hypothetical protein